MKGISIATTSQGFCGGCGAEISAGEQFRVLAGNAVHVGCEGKSRGTETTPTLFALTAAAPDPEPTNQRPRRVFTPVSLDDGQRSSALRLMGQLGRTYDLMSDQKWRTLTDLATRLGCLETSAGARLRDLRKREHGGHVVLCRLRADGSGEREYRLVLKTNGAVDAA